MVFVYDQGCESPTGRCRTEILDAGATVTPTFCLCDGTFHQDNTGARRPYRSTGACPVEPPPTDGGADAGIDAGGVCCPVTGSEGCLGVDVYVGGWAPLMAACSPTSWSNGLPRRRGTDARGCAILEENPSAPRCNLLALDAGPDVPPGAVYCTDPGGTRVVDPRTNPSHCGGCGRRCCGGFCVAGRCTSDGPPGSLACPLSAAEEAARGCFGDVTVQPLSDPNHCGGCGVRCAAGEVCSSAMCVRADAGLDASRDADGDGPTDAD
jgi:hypothetical protein